MGAERRAAAAGQGAERGRVPAALRDRGAVPGGAVPAALGQGLGLPGLRPRRLCRAQGPGGLPVQPLQAPGRADRGHGVPLDQIAADHLVSGDLPPEPEQGRDELGRAGAPAGHAAADRLADEAQADGGDGGARGRRSPSSRAGSRSTTPISAGSARAASAAGVPPARRRSWPRSRRRPSASPGGCGSPWSRASASRRSRRWPSATSPPAATSSPTACPAGRRSSRPAATTSRWSPARGPQAAKWAPFTWVNTALGNIKTALAGTYHHVSAKHAQRYLTSFAWRFNRRYQLDTLTERLAYACARTAPHPYRVIIAG